MNQERANAMLTSNLDQDRARIDDWVREIGQRRTAGFALALMDGLVDLKEEGIGRVVKDLALIALGEAFLRVNGSESDPDLEGGPS